MLLVLPGKPEPLLLAALLLLRAELPEAIDVRELVEAEPEDCKEVGCVDEGAGLG